VITSSPLQTADIIFHYFPELTSSQRSQIQKLEPLYRDWNEKINVVSRKDIDNLYVNHILHSLSLARAVSFLPGARVLDVGTGGGFPGIPLAILFPETRFDLVDSIGKKITVVKNVAADLGLHNVNASQIRAELIEDEYDFIISRAVTRLKEFHSWVKKRVKKRSIHQLDNGILYLKGGDLEEEMAELKQPYRIFEISDYFKEDFFHTKKIVYVPL
jgi:16S rRNA (guanine527-N7)-methyltransferase